MINDTFTSALPTSNLSLPFHTLHLLSEIIPFLIGALLVLAASLDQTIAAHITLQALLFLSLYLIHKLVVLLINLTPFLLVIFTILYQDEVKRVVREIFRPWAVQREMGENVAMVITDVCRALIAKRRIDGQFGGQGAGAVILVQRTESADQLLGNSTVVDAKLSTSLILHLLDSNSNPSPNSEIDGDGILIKDGSIDSVGTFFPPWLNHAAYREDSALMVTNTCDVVLIVVNTPTSTSSKTTSMDEESPSISIFHGGSHEKFDEPDSTFRTRLIDLLTGDPSTLPNHKLFDTIPTFSISFPLPESSSYSEHGSQHAITYEIKSLD